VLQKVVDFIGQQTSDPAPADFLDSIFKPVKDGYLVGIPQEALATATTSKKLGDSDVFQDAVPDAKGAPVVLFVNLEQIQKSFSVDSSALSKLKALGVTVRSDGKNSVTRMRLTFR